MLSIYDEAHSTDEERWITMGLDRNDVLLIVVHTFENRDGENTTIRIISARKATKREERAYKEG